MEGPIVPKTTPFFKPFIPSCRAGWKHKMVLRGVVFLLYKPLKNKNMNKTTETDAKTAFLNRFINWVKTNYKHSKGGYYHRGDFNKDMKPKSLESLKDLFLDSLQP